MNGVLLIAVMAVVGGAIAFIGDRLGTKIGKKRLSLMGLRPRHTSVIITILTGTFITLSTLMVMSALSANVRTALFGMEQLKQQMSETKNQLQQASLELVAAQKEKEAAGEALTKAKGQVDKLQTQQAALEKRSQELAEGNKMLEMIKAELTERNSSLQQDNQQLGAKNEELSSMNSALLDDNKTLEKRTEELRQGIQIMREGNIVFQAGEVLSSGVIRGSRDETEVQADFAVLVQQANRNVALRLGDNTMDKEIWIYQPEYDEAVKEIAASKTDMVVRIVAAGNLLRGEPIRSSVKLYKNSVIYTNNEFVLSHEYMMQGKGNGEAESILMNFLQEVNGAAAQRGVLRDPLRGSIGVMDGAQFYDLVEKISPHRGSFVLSAFSDGETDALGPLRLKIKVDFVNSLLR